MIIRVILQSFQYQYFLVLSRSSHAAVRERELRANKSTSNKTKGDAAVTPKITSYFSVLQSPKTSVPGTIEGVAYQKSESTSESIDGVLDIGCQVQKGEFVSSTSAAAQQDTPEFVRYVE